jgi:MSHA biogenesis protein MshJ
VKLPPQLISVAARFDRLSLRERMLVIAATVAVLIAAANVLLTGRLDARRSQLLAELSELQSGSTGMTAATSDGAADPMGEAYARASELRAQLAGIDAQLTAQSAGMIESRRMAEVIHDVLRLQHGVVLVSLRNLPAVELAANPATQSASPGRPPYVHSVELVLEGRYLDILAYLQDLEHLPWHFYWRQLDLATQQYPINRVRVELGTVSMDSDWINL